VDSCEVEMTKQKTFKRRVRERMAKTGESYASAREALIGSEPAGIHPETSALRFALADAGIEISEALTLIIAGGAGAACMSFHYAKEDFTHLHLSGWNPFQSDIRDAVQRLRLTADVHETGGAKAAERMLRERLAASAVQIAWVDEGTLRGVPAEEGMAYHVIAVLAVDGDVARIYDRTPQTVPAERLAAARARIRKDRNRLLAIAGAEPDLEHAVRAGLERCARGPLNPPTPGMSLEGIARWADAWPKPFPAGAHRDGALRDMTTAIRRSGGGLLRNLQAQGLREAAVVLSLPDLLGVAELTADLAREWEALAADHDDLATRVRTLYAHEKAAYESLQALLL
jgi:hypothetical protein